MSNENNKRITVLLGAGAVLDWGAPRTDSLTKLVIDSGCNIQDDSMKVTKFIYDELISSGYKMEQINFETIINVLEELIIFYSYSNNKSKMSSFMKIFYNFKFENTFFKKSTEESRIENLGIDTLIENQDVSKQTVIENNEFRQQMFFQNLLVDLLTNISSRILKYAYHSNTSSKIITDENEDLNNLFTRWIKYLNPENNILRFYTLNYERLFKILMLNSGIIEVFEGFDCGEFIEIGEKLKPNILRIINDYNSHCHYNIHGSTFWGINPRGNSNLLNSEFYLSRNPQFQYNFIEQSNIQIEHGKNILISNIITGYQKAQKGYIVPFKQMQGAFDKDCLLSDYLYIIGYSFGDEHINMSIKTALKHNEKLKLCIVDPTYDGDKGYDLLKERFISVFASLFNNQFNYKMINENCNYYFNNKIIVCAVTMKEFLAKKLYENFN